MSRNLILGIWDGHDAGIALVDGNEILFAINEERLSRRKLDVGFPHRSIQAALDYCQLTSSDIACVACTTTDIAKTLTRLFPPLKEKYYRLRRKLSYPGRLYFLQKHFKYWLTSLPPIPGLTELLSSLWLRRNLKAHGMDNAKIVWVDHHAAHAATAGFCCGFPETLVITLDGVGDGASGTVWMLRDGNMKRLKTYPARDSLGILFEHVTNIMNMRELEDEGKVMALANYAYPVSAKANPMMGFAGLDSVDINFKFRGHALYQALRRVFWGSSFEKYCYFAQSLLESMVVGLVEAWIETARIRYVAYAGGVASNVKANRLVREAKALEKLYVFPHMGDGGQALGAALWANYQANSIARYSFANIYWGLSYDDEVIWNAAQQVTGIQCRKIDDPAVSAAELIAQGEVVFWFQGRMEYGPRALGGRSILALPNSLEIKDALNLKLKKRVWFQPFCPSMLGSEAARMLENYDPEAPDRFMTCAYRVAKEHLNDLAGVIGIDGSCRPQVLDDADISLYAGLLKEVRQRTGFGVVLNTSFNIHGEPMVCSPADAINALLQTDVKHLIAGNYYIYTS